MPSEQAPHSEVHLRKKGVERLFPESSFWNKGRYAVQPPGSKYRTSQAHGLELCWAWAWAWAGLRWGMRQASLPPAATSDPYGYALTCSAVDTRTLPTGRTPADRPWQTLTPLGLWFWGEASPPCVCNPSARPRAPEPQRDFPAASGVLLTRQSGR